MCICGMSFLMILDKMLNPDLKGNIPMPINSLLPRLIILPSTLHPQDLFPHFPYIMAVQIVWVFALSD